MNPEEQIRLNKRIELEKEIAKAIFDDIEKLMFPPSIRDKGDKISWGFDWQKLRKRWLE